MIMRPLLLALLLAAALPAAAQQAKPPVLQPLPAPPPPPAGYEPDPAQEPQVNVIIRPTETIEEYRLNGKVYMIKVTPKNGKPYFLVDNIGNGKFVRHDDYDTGLRPPSWVILQF
jgi:hypothetical protein